MLETILVALLISKIKGYKVNVVVMEKAFYPLFVCEIIYWCIQMSLFAGNYAFLPYAAVFKSIYLCTTLFIVFRYDLAKYALIGAICVLVGGWCNDVAIAANGGYMPVFPSLSYLTGYVSKEAFGVADQLHILGNEWTKAKYLTDIFDIGYSILSIGDLLIRLLPGLVLYKGIQCANKEQRMKMSKEGSKENV
ncbi:MAG: DUF5317 family protein [Cellulosilyticaceae bacterium]